MTAQTSHKKKRFIPLRYRFILMIALLLILVLGILGLVLGTLQSHTIRNRIKSRGMFMARNLAAIAMDDLKTYNYIALEKAANRTADHPDVICVVIHDKEGKIAGFSGRPDLQNQALTDAESHMAVAATAPQVHEGIFGPEHTPTMNIIFPAREEKDRTRWGTIRVTLSLAPMNQQIRQTLWSIAGLGFFALFAGISFASLAARRITGPLDQLVNLTVEAARGNFKQNTHIQTGDEVEILSANFSNMIKKILAQRAVLEKRLREIRQLQQHSEMVLETMGDGLLSVSREGRVRQMNPAAREILDIPGDVAFRDAPVPRILEQHPDLIHYIDQITNAPNENRAQEIHLQADGNGRIVLMGFGVLDAQPDSPMEIIFNLHDITEFKQLESRMRQARRLADIGIIAAGLAHEIRNPLSAIKTYAGLLPRKVDKPGFLEKFQRTVPREINRLNRLVEELLELARPPAYRFSLQAVEMLLHNTLEVLEAELEANGIRCIRNFAPDLGEIRADADQLAKVFHNLIRNASQVMPDGGTLTISASRQDKQITIAVQDTGPGMTRETLDTIFTPFFTTKHKGTGLGLAITQKVVTEHGGEIKATSILDQGSCFTLVLPSAH